MARTQPNVLLIVSEDHGPHLGCYGDPNARTPVLDQLAADGVRFVNHHTTCAICSPGRASILTGLYPHQNGQIHLATHRYAMYRPFRNLASVLKEAGYHTGRLGKLHVLPEAGFSFDFVWNEPGSISFAHRDVEATRAAAGRFFDEAEAAGAPFFLYTCFSDAHLPMLHESFGVPANPLRGEDVLLPSFCPVDAPHMRDRLAGYYNCLERLDTGIGLILEEVRRRTGRETVVLFTVDHGQQFIRGKMTIYEGGLRVPLIMHAPGRIGTSLVREELTSHVDILPTVLDMVGLPPLDERPGLSLVGVAGGEGARLAGDGTGTARAAGAVAMGREYVVGQWTGNAPVWFPQRSIRDRRYKLIVNYLSRENLAAKAYLPPGRWESSLDEEDFAAVPAELRAALERSVAPPPEELYDLHADPHELHNLAGRPEVAAVQARLHSALLRWQEEHDDRIADPEGLVALTQMHEEVARQKYPGGYELVGSRDELHYGYDRWLDPGIRT